MATTTPREPAQHRIADLLARVPARDRYPTWTELREALDRLVARSGGRLVRERIGASSEGRPLEKLTIGHGARAVLVVGGPHANEPVGGATIEALLALLVDDPSLERAAGCTWHVIPCIDPDGLERNRGWVETPLSLQRYARHFFRPAFPDQAEYSFPLVVPGYSFGNATPENAAWKRVLDDVRPQLQFSLHNAESGGVFHIVTDPDPALHAALVALVRDLGLALSPIGEAFGELEPQAEGVFRFPDLARIAAAGDRGAWWAGDSSEGYARRYGTRSATTEVPLWRCTARGAATTLSLVLDEHLDLAARLLRALERPARDVLASGAIPPVWRRALDEALTAFPRRQAALARVRERLGARPGGEVTPERAVDYATQLALFRQRFAALCFGAVAGAGSPSSEPIAAVLDECVRKVEATGSLVPVPPQQCVAAQLGALLMTTAPA